MGRRRQYTQESVERALDLHCPGRWERLAMSNGGPGYVVQTGIGPLHLRTLKETYAYCVGAADADRRARTEA